MLIEPLPVFHSPTPPTTYPPVTKKLLKNLNASVGCGSARAPCWNNRTAMHSANASADTRRDVNAGADRNLDIDVLLFAEIETTGQRPANISSSRAHLHTKVTFVFGRSNRNADGLRHKSPQTTTKVFARSHNGGRKEKAALRASLSEIRHLQVKRVEAATVLRSIRAAGAVASVSQAGAPPADTYEAAAARAHSDG